MYSLFGFLKFKKSKENECLKDEELYILKEHYKDSYEKNELRIRKLKNQILALKMAIKKIRLNLNREKSILELERHSIDEIKVKLNDEKSKMENTIKDLSTGKKDLEESLKVKEKQILKLQKMIYDLSSDKDYLNPFIKKEMRNYIIKAIDNGENVGEALEKIKFGVGKVEELFLENNFLLDRYTSKRLSFIKEKVDLIASDSEKYNEAQHWDFIENQLYLLAGLIHGGFEKSLRIIVSGEELFKMLLNSDIRYAQYENFKNFEENCLYALRKCSLPEDLFFVNTFFTDEQYYYMEDFFKYDFESRLLYKKHKFNYVYIIANDAGTHYKIGATGRDVENRFIAAQKHYRIQTNTNEELKIIKLFETENGALLEEYLHKKFGNRKIEDFSAREWFSLEDEDLIYLLHDGYKLDEEFMRIYNHKFPGKVDINSKFLKIS